MDPFFYSRNGKQGDIERMEIDFLIRRENKICPVEVKSAAYQHHASLDKFRRRFGDRLGVATILYTKDVMVDELDLKWRLARHAAAVDHALTKTALAQQPKDIYRAYVLDEEPPMT